MDHPKTIDETFFLINNQKPERKRQQSPYYLDKNYSKKWLKNYFIKKP